MSQTPSDPMNSREQSGQLEQPTVPPFPPQTGEWSPPNYGQSPQEGDYPRASFTPPKETLQMSKQPNIWKGVSLVLSILVVILLTTTTTLALILTHLPASNNATSPGGQPTTGAPPTQTGQNPTSAPTSSASSTSANPTATPASSTSYSAVQPGPGCDTGGGTWTTQGTRSITCGTFVITASADAHGYLYLQLPQSKAFSPKNIIGVTGKVNGDHGRECVGLAEEDVNTGYLAEYCSDGGWFIYTISGDGAIMHTLSQSVTATRASTQISLTLAGTTLSFTIDSEVYKVSISPIQPTKVAIAYSSNACDFCGITTENFSYAVSPG